MATQSNRLTTDFLRRAVTGNAQPIDVERATVGMDEARRYAPVGFGETFGAGVASGGEGMINDFEYFKALGNTLLGNEQAAADNIQSARIKAEFAANPLFGMETFEEFTKAPTVGGFLDQVVLGVGQITPSIASSIATGFTGVLAATAGKAVLGAAGKATAKKLTQDAIEKRARGEALDKAEEEYLNASYDLFTKETAKYGGIAGLTAGEMPLMSGGAFAEFDDAGVELTPDRALQSLLIGGAQTAVSVGGEVFVLGKLANLAKSKGITEDGFIKQIAKGTAKGFGTSGAIEGTAETIQEGISVAQRMSVDDTYTAEQAQLRLGQAAFIGFFGGGAPGALGGAVASTVSAANSERVFSKAKGMLDDHLQSVVSGEVDEQQLGIGPDGGPSIEPMSDINAQIAATADPDSGKAATWIPINQGVAIDTEASPNEVFEIPYGDTTLYGALIPEQGTIISADRTTAEQVVRSGADEESLRIALGYSSTKTGDQVVRVKDADGNVISEQATDEAGLLAAQQSANRIAGSKGTVDVVSAIQALTERRERSASTRNMMGNIDEVDPNEQEGSFTTEAQERELSEGFNEIDEAQTEEVADYAISRANRQDPGVFENNWVDILALVPPEERAKVAALEPVASEGFAKGFLAYLQNDPGYYSVEQREGRLFISRAPDSGDSFMSGSTKEGAATQRATSVVQKLLAPINVKDSITTGVANRYYFFRGEEGLKTEQQDKRRNAPREKLKTRVKSAVFTVERPDGSTTPIAINKVIVRGRELNVGTQDALVGENLSPAQSTKAAFARGLAVLAEEGYKVSFLGNPVNFTIDTARVALGTASARSEVFGDIGNSKNVLARMSAGAKAQITSRQWIKNLSEQDAKIFNDLIIFQSGGQSFSLSDLLNTADPIPQESVQSEERGELQPRIAMERAERRLEQQIREYINAQRRPIIRMNGIVQKIKDSEPLTDSDREFLRTSGLPQRFQKVPDYAEVEAEARRIAYDPEADRLNIYQEQELEKLREAEIGFSPSDLADRSRTEDVIGTAAPSTSLTPEADAIRKVSEWKMQETQRQREAMNAGTRPVVSPAELDAEIDAQGPAKLAEFIAEAEASIRPGTTTGGSIELEDEIEQGQIQAAREAGVFREDQTVDPDPQRAADARRRSAELAQIQSDRQTSLLRTGGRIALDNEAAIQEAFDNGEINEAQRDARLDALNDPAAQDIPFEGISDFEVERRQRNQRNEVQRAVEPANHPSRLIFEEAPAAGGFNAVQQQARGTVPNLPVNQRKQEYINLRQTNPLKKSQVKQFTEIKGDIGEAAGRVLAEALEIFSQQITKPLSVYTESEWVALGESPLGPENYGAVKIFANRYVVILKDSFSDGDVAGVQERMAAVLGHEMGHIIFDQEITRLSDEDSPLFKSLMGAFQKDALENDVDQYNGKNGFEEWYADQVASYLYDNTKRARNGVQSYFKRIAAKMREFFNAVNEFLGGRLTANADFRAYVRDVVAANKKNLDLYKNLTGESHLDAVDKAVIRNWNGKIFEQVPDKAVESAQKMTQRMLKSGAYGIFMKYGTANDNWLRSLGPAGVKLAQMFYAKSQSKEKSGFQHDKTTNENRFLQKLAAAMNVSPNSVQQWDTPELNAIVQEAEDETIDTANLSDPRSKAIRAVFEEFHRTYLRDEKGRPYFQVRRRKNYAPRLIDFHGLENSPEMQEQLAELLIRYPNPSKGNQNSTYRLTIEEARTVVKNILFDPTENPDVAQNNYDRLRDAQFEALGQAKTPEERAEIQKKIDEGLDAETLLETKDRGHLQPGFRNALARSLGAIPTKELRAIGALAPPVLAFVRYFHHATRRVEFEKRGGEPRVTLLLDQIPEDQREYARQAIMAQLGRVGIGMKPWVRNLNSVDAVWSSTTTLLFTAFTSFTDMAGPIIRSKDFAGMSRVFSELNRSLTTDENQKLSRAVGVASVEAASNIFMAAGELDYANSTARRILDYFFRYTGLQLYTRFSREFAAGMGREFLLDIANREQNEKHTEWLNELDITRDQILAWDSGNGSFDTPEGKAVAKAIARFVDESIVRPNAAERPVWASHPMAMVVWRLKSYFLSFGKTVLGGMGREIQNRYRQDGDFRGGGMLLAMAMGTMLPLAALGMEMKELTKWMLQALIPGIEASGRTFRSDHMSSPEYLATLVEKSGALGPWAIPLSIIQSAKWGDNPIVSQVPIVDLADATLLEGNWTRPIPLINNID